MARKPKATAATENTAAGATEETAAPAAAPAVKPASLEAVTWQNEPASVEMRDLRDDSGDTTVRVELIRGKLKRSNDRVKAVVFLPQMEGDEKGFEASASNAEAAIRGALTSAEEKPEEYGVKAAVAAIVWPEVEADTGPKTWREYEDAAALSEAIDAAKEGAGYIIKGESQTREGYRELGQAIARVSATLEKAEHFAAWLKDAGQDVESLVGGSKNAKAELVFMGRLDATYFDLAPQSTTSAKAFQQRFNVQKAELAEAVVISAFVDGAVPDAAALNSAMLETLAAEGDVAEGGTMTQKHRLARLAYEALTGKAAIVTATEGEARRYAPAKDEGGAYVAGTMFGGGNRANEVVAAVCAAATAKLSEAPKTAAKEAAAAERAAVDVLRPRVFAEYSVTEAAMHLGNILQAHGDWSEVLDVLIGMADRVTGGATWAETLAQVKAQVDEAAAADNRDEAEQAADDEA